jgi:hypothetical protein
MTIMGQLPKIWRLFLKHTKASPEMTSARRGKRRACDTDTDVGIELEKLKSAKE